MLSKFVRILITATEWMTLLMLCLYLIVHARKDVAKPPTTAGNMVMASPIITVEAGVGRYYVEAEDGVVLIVRQRKEDSSIDIYAMRKEDAR